MAYIKLAVVAFQLKRASYVSREVESKLLKLIFQAILGDTVQLVQGKF